MEGFLKIVEKVNGAVNGFVWGLPMLILLVGMTVMKYVTTRYVYGGE